MTPNEVTNLASRLQSAAGPGQVMLSEEAYRRVREWLEDRGMPVEQAELTVKGFPHPVTAFRVTSGLAAPV